MLTAVISTALYNDCSSSVVDSHTVELNLKNPPKIRLKNTGNWLVILMAATVWPILNFMFYSLDKLKPKKNKNKNWNPKLNCYCLNFYKKNKSVAFGFFWNTLTKIRFLFIKNQQLSMYVKNKLKNRQVLASSSHFYGTLQRLQ